MSSSCTLTSAVQDSLWNAFMHSKQNVLVQEQSKFLRNWCFCISMEQNTFVSNRNSWSQCYGERLLFLLLEMDTQHKIILVQSFSSDDVFGCLSHVANHNVTLAGWKGYFPLSFTKVGTRLLCTVAGGMVSTVKMIEKSKILLLAGNRSWREVTEPTDVTLSRGLYPFLPKIVKPIC